MGKADGPKSGTVIKLPRREKGKSISRELDAAALSAVREFEVKHSERSRAPYDGILGHLPSWFPLRDQRMFESVRHALLDLFPDDRQTLYRWLKTELAMVATLHGDAPKFALVSTDIPAEAKSALQYLAWLKYCCTKGEQLGLRLLHGEKTANALEDRKKNAEGGKKAGQARRAEWPAVWRMAKSKQAEGIPDEEIIKQISETKGLSKSQVRRILKSPLRE